MSRKNTQKLLLLTVASFSLFSFLFVNGHAYCQYGKPLGSVELLEKKAMKEEEEEKQDIKLPDVTALQKLFSLAQRFVPGSN